MILLLSLLACQPDADTGKPADDTDTPTDDTGAGDADGDGYSVAAGDCADDDGTRYPGATEACDGVDNNCDGATDEGLLTAWYADADVDGYGDADALTWACEAPAGAVTDNDDCDDADATIHPGAPEVDCADPVDRNCDGSVGGVDGDADGWVACRDCNDGDGAVSPDATEACNGQDDDCDAAIDEAGATGETTWHYDGDADGYGNPSVLTTACQAPPGYVADATDCNDGAATCSPAGVEVCDGLDNNCDGAADETGGAAWYADADGDGYGDASTMRSACTAPAGFVGTSSDCDDAVAAVSPVAAEVCDSIDNDCDGAIDEAGGALVYADADGDGYGDPAMAIVGCATSDGYVVDATDCDDADASTSPGAPDVCGDGLDQDCDGAVDDDCAEVVSHCGAIAADEVWEGEDEHLVTCDVYVQGSGAPRLTIEDGARVVFSPGTSLYVGWSQSGDLQVEGGSRGVTFTSTSEDPAPGDWGGLAFGPYDRGSVVAGATVEYGGGNGYGNVYAYYTPLLTLRDSRFSYSMNSGVYVHIATLAMSDSEASDNEDFGVYLYYYAALASGGGPTFTNNVLTGNGDAPLTVPAPYVGQVGDGNVISGNADEAVYVFDGTIGETSTIRALDVPWLLSGDVVVGASGGMTLTVADGAELQFAPGAGMSVGTGGYADFVVEGSTAGVTFTSLPGQETPGAWDGVYVGPYAERVEIDGATFTYAGGAYAGALYLYDTGDPVVITRSTIAESATGGVYANGYSTLAMSDSTVRDNAATGVYVHTYGALDGDGSFARNVVTGNRVGMELPAAYAGALASDGAYGGNDEADVTLDPDTVESDTRMRALDVPWRVLGEIWVGSSARPRLTIDDGAVVQFDPSAGIVVGAANPGSLVVDGSTAGVTLTSAQARPAAGDWDGVYFGWHADDSRIAGCDLGYAGGNGYGSVAFDSAGAGTTGGFVIDGCDIHDGWTSGVYAQYADDIEVRDTTVRDNASYGLYFASNTGLRTTGGPTFTGNVVTGNGLLPLVLPAGYADQIDASSSLSGNGIDIVSLLGGYVTRTGTWQRLDVDYRVDGDVVVEDSTSPVLTIEPGVSVTFSPNASLGVGSNTYGQLQAVGTATNPVVFTSAQASPHVGDWDGMYFGTMDTGSVLRDCVVEYGGGWIANLYFVGNGSRVTVADCAVESSASWGIYRYMATPVLTGVTYGGNVAGDLY